jgi:hypothetical protein
MLRRLSGCGARSLAFAGKLRQKANPAVTNTGYQKDA